MKSKALMLLAFGAVAMFVAGPAWAGDKKMMKPVNYKVVDGYKIPQSLTGKPGDAERGRKLAINRKKGNCLACHILPIPEQPFHGKIGPNLNQVAERYSEGEIRLRVVDPKVLNPDTIMPSFYKYDGFHRILKKFEGKSILSAQEVEDIVAYMLTLK